MKWLLLPILWLCALAIALFVLWRMAQGRHVVLRGRFGPRLVRMVVIILVTLGIGIERSDGEEPARTATQPPPQAPQPPPALELPAAIKQDIVARWLSLQNGRSLWSRFKQLVLQSEQSPTMISLSDPFTQRMTAELPPKFRAIALAELTARSTGKAASRVPAGELLAALSELEAGAYYDHFLVAYLFRLSAASLRDGVVQRADAEPFVQLYAKLAVHVRLTNTLLAAQARVKPMMLRPRAWMSKAYNPMREPTQFSFLPLHVAEMLGACKVLYGSANLGTWEKDGVELFSLEKQSAPLTLYRSPLQTVLAGQPLRLGRLDLIETPRGTLQVTLLSDAFGAVRLPAGRVISVWELPRYLSPEARSKLNATIAEAMSGNESAAERLELHLPLAHSALREALRKQPQEKGAPRLRMILSLFDDTVMPHFESPVSSSYSTDAAPAEIE